MRKLENIVCKLGCPPILVLQEHQLSKLNNMVCHPGRKILLRDFLLPLSILNFSANLTLCITPLPLDLELLRCLKKVKKSLNLVGR